MKKTISFILAIALALSLSVTAVAADSGFNAGLTVDRSVAGQISVTVADSSVLAEKQPTLTIPCSFDAAYVRFGSAAVESSLDTEKDEISFTVAAGGRYVIYSGVEPLPPAPQVPVSDQQVTVPVSGQEKPSLPPWRSRTALPGYPLMKPPCLMSWANTAKPARWS